MRARYPGGDAVAVIRGQIRVKPPIRWLVASVLVFCAGSWIWLSQERDLSVGGAGPDLGSILTQEESGFATAEGVWEFRFPADHGGHPEFRSEIWYLTANLEDERGHRYGAQLAFFRLRLRPEATERPSAWGSNQVFRAHFALTDAEQGRFVAAERFSRTALGLSGMEQSPIRVWLEDWSLASTDMQLREGALRVRAASGELALELDLLGEKPPLLEGAADILPATQGGGAFHFYLMPRLLATGTLRVGGTETRLVGRAWLDHAWGEVPMSQGQIALNRFALQLGDGRDILCLQLRRRDGSGTPIPSCLLLKADGAARSFRRREILLEPLAHWSGELDGTRYPLSWRLELPSERLELEVVPLLEAQELDFAIQTWSGAVEVSGRSAGEPVSGRGHLELSGYIGAEEGE